MLTDHRRAGMDIAAGNRVSLLRHRAARTSAVSEGFEDFADLRLHHQLDVGRELAERGRYERQKSADFRNAVADGVPRDVRLTEPKFFHQVRLRLERAGLQGCKRPHRSAEFTDQDARTQLPE